MAYVKEPKGIDFTVDNRPLTNKEKAEISDFIKKYKEKMKRQSARKKSQRKKTIKT